jgi:hypothetical protein
MGLEKKYNSKQSQVMGDPVLSQKNLANHNQHMMGMNPIS